ncbi:carboxymethylenebutenolidase [Halopolyspora algeriensis]|uniref:Carboxymethylenebutenolidase n=1 Tax=Halopolyspora algeriensis TaxID=1500506 RepID=A0A368VRR6_9ACTN|nr:dienelactone hydrolase family protein [Halopolyspora algeriensis]RCW43157.1 carboxymethylenebutenolidase [Halopolyspora algeriensis]TQM56215.1 carboxymethylenebutenolidase [Halopolyspora algeriensis]
MTEANPHQNVTFTSNGETAHGYLAVPASGQGPGVLVIQEWWGLTDHVADVTDRFAAEGFVALAPDLYGGRTTHDSGQAATMMNNLPVERAARDLSGAIDHLLAHPAVVGTSVGAVGFCMGGKFVLVMAAREGNRIGAAVPFYGLPSIEETDFSHLTAPVLGHYGEHDRSVTPEAVDGLRARITADSEVTPHIHFYPAGHAFFNDSNPSTHHEESARTAWTRTLEFLRTHLS